MLLLGTKVFVACWITLMSSVGVWLPIFFVRRARQDRASAGGPRTRRSTASATPASTKLWLSLANCVSAGMLITMALLHFFPEAFEVDEPGARPDAPTLCAWMLVGLMFPAVLEQSMSGGGGHSHGVASEADEEHGHTGADGKAVATSTLLIVLMCFHGMTEGLLLGFEGNVAALLSATVPLSVHKLCDGLVIGVAMAKELRSPAEEDMGGGGDAAEAAAPGKVARTPTRFWHRLFRGPVGVWLLLTPLTMIGVIVCSAFWQGGAAAVGGHHHDDADVSTPAHGKIAPVSTLSAVQAVGSGSFVYIGLSILSGEELKGLAANAALLVGAGCTAALFRMTSHYH
ncbi:ZIP Zinc transporter [Novymonas esmeraldas]|uniref:ZIP Zinc transporter n=1 Tax=Novymonas esmeraldas TaxID=1808958 RepID=A0AAW0ESV2_9TRYP